MQRRILWTYHVNMRMKGRFIPRKMILDSVDTYDIIEAYPEDKYMPSYLVHAKHEDRDIHILFAVDTENEMVRIVTTYRPSSDEWIKDMKRRRTR